MHASIQRTFTSLGSEGPLSGVSNARQWSSWLLLLERAAASILNEDFYRNAVEDMTQGVVGEGTNLGAAFEVTVVEDGIGAVR